MSNEKPTLLKRLSSKYRVNIINPENFEELSSFSFSWLQVFMVMSMLVMISFILSLGIMIYTPFQEYFSNTKKNVINDAYIANLYMKVDSLERNLAINEQYITNVRRVLNGEAADDHELEQANENEDQAVKPVKNEELFYVSPEDSALRKELQAESFELSSKNENKDVSLHFYTPVNGVVVEKYNTAEKHLALDIVADKEAPIKAIADGNVIFAEYSASTGNVIMVQHPNNFISVYKHNSVILKPLGSFVRAGETIGIIGNSGEITTGPHLHFELWLNGQSIDPEQYIVF